MRRQLGAVEYLVEYLVEQVGVDVNAAYGEVSICCAITILANIVAFCQSVQDKETVLHWAVRHNQLAVVKYLIESTKVDVNARTKVSLVINIYSYVIHFHSINIHHCISQ